MQQRKQSVAIAVGVWPYFDFDFERPVLQASILVGHAPQTDEQDRRRVRQTSQVFVFEQLRFHDAGTHGRPCSSYQPLIPIQSTNSPRSFLLAFFQIRLSCSRGVGMRTMPAWTAAA